jgi:hypothetical protein
MAVFTGLLVLDLVGAIVEYYECLATGRFIWVNGAGEVDAGLVSGYAS